VFCAKSLEMWSILRNCLGNTYCSKKQDSIDILGDSQRTAMIADSMLKVKKRDEMAFSRSEKNLWEMATA